MCESAIEAVSCLQRRIEEIEYDTGYYVLEGPTDTRAFLSMVGENEDADLVPTDRERIMGFD